MRRSANRAENYTLINKLAFTLAEVLIVLGIIGIIAEMTIPTLIGSANDKAAAVTIKKEMSVLQQAVTMAIAEEGPVDYWYTGNDSNEANVIVANILKRYLKVGKDCGIGGTGCLAPSYASLSKALNQNYSFGLYQIVLADGTSLAIWGVQGTGGAAPVNTLQGIMFDVDTNGLKGPNRAGDDLFFLILDGQNAALNTGTKPNLVRPYGGGSPGTGRPLNRICSAISSDSTVGSGFNCTGWVIYNENLDYKYVDDLNWVSKFHK